MRKELYKKICDELQKLYMVDGQYVYIDEGGPYPSGSDRVIKHIDLWNQNVEFLEQEVPWERPAVFVEFEELRWLPVERGVEYRADAIIDLHVVTDWEGSSEAGSVFMDESLQVYDLLDEIHRTLARLNGNRFNNFDLLCSRTNHNHEEIVEYIEQYRCTALKKLV